MGRMNWMIVKKRIILFLVLGLTTSIMNLFLWNETSQLIRQVPNLITLKKISSQDMYEINYIPNADTEGRVKPFTAIELENIDNLWHEILSIPAESLEVYLNKQEYFKSDTFDSADSVLLPFKMTDLEEMDKSSLTHPKFMNDILLRNVDQNQIEKIEKAATEIGYPLQIVSINERYQIEFDYYVNNFIFGLIMSMVFMSFSLSLVYWIITASLKLFYQEIRLLRIIGLTLNKIKSNFILLLTIPCIISFFVFLTFVHSIGIQPLIIDYIYLFLLNFILLVFSSVIIKHKVGRMLYA